MRSSRFRPATLIVACMCLTSASYVPVLAEETSVHGRVMGQTEEGEHLGPVPGAKVEFLGRAAEEPRLGRSRRCRLLPHRRPCGTRVRISNYGVGLSRRECSPSFGGLGRRCACARFRSNQRGQSAGRKPRRQAQREAPQEAQRQAGQKPGRQSRDEAERRPRRDSERQLRRRFRRNSPCQDMERKRRQAVSATERRHKLATHRRRAGTGPLNWGAGAQRDSGTGWKLARFGFDVGRRHGRASGADPNCRRRQGRRRVQTPDAAADAAGPSSRARRRTTAERPVSTATWRTPNESCS